MESVHLEDIIWAYLILLHFASRHSAHTCIMCSLQIEGSRQPCVEQVFLHHLNSILLTSCLSHFGTLAIFRDYGICCGGLRSVICDITAVTVSGHRQPHPYKLANAVSNCVCSDCCTDPPFAHLSPSPWTSLP